jgi:diguanylate cyclase (GGDEF)-like protein
VGRWGGEELLVLLRGATPGTLRHLAERCRTLVEASRILYRDQAVSVTISIGATLVSERDSVASIVKRVDQLLYESKARGRNRTSIG